MELGVLRAVLRRRYERSAETLLGGAVPEGEFFGCVGRQSRSLWYGLCVWSRERLRGIWPLIWRFWGRNRSVLDYDYSSSDTVSELDYRTVFRESEG